MNRIRRNTLVLMVVIVLLLVFPSIGDTVRGAVAYLVGETGSRILGALASIATILTLLYVILEPQIRQSNQGSPGHTPESPTARTGDGHSQSRQETTGAQTTHPDNDARRRIRDEAQDVAREVNEWAHERMLDDPFSRAGREGHNPEMGTPEYRDLEAAYNNHMDETARQYQNTLLPKIAQVRAALNTYNVNDSELNMLDGRPKNYDDYRTVSERLWEMAGTVDRQIPPQRIS